MTDQEIRIAVAECCGWTFVPSHDVESTRGGYPHAVPESWKHEDGSSVWEDKGLPNYPKDLNAMHEAEKWLMKNNWTLYRDVYIRRYMDCYQHNGISAEAHERAVAFVKTMDKWKQ